MFARMRKDEVDTFEMRQERRLQSLRFCLTSLSDFQLFSIVSMLLSHSTTFINSRSSAFRISTTPSLDHDRTNIIGHNQRVSCAPQP